MLIGEQLAELGGVPLQLPLPQRLIDSEQFDSLFPIKHLDFHFPSAPILTAYSARATGLTSRAATGLSPPTIAPAPGLARPGAPPPPTGAPAPGLAHTAATGPTPTVSAKWGVTGPSSSATGQ